MDTINSEIKEQEIIDAIIAFNNDPEVQQLQAFYYNQSVPEIFGISRRELSHSAFLAWLFNPNSNHSLSQKPLMQLLELYLRCYREQGKTYIDNAKKIPNELQLAILTRDITISGVEVKTEETVKTNKTVDGRADIVISCDVRIPNSKIVKLRVVIENKVYSNEHDKQTWKYFNYHEANLLHDDNGEEIEVCLYIYLTPLVTKNYAECESFVHLTYQDLLEHILERLLIQTDLHDRTRFILIEYINSLSLPADYVDEQNCIKKGKTIMAIGEKESALLRSFWKKYSTLFTAALTALSTDKSMSEDEQEDVAKTLEYVQNLEGKKRYRYAINNQGEYPCGQVVVELIKLYVENNPTTTLEDINKAFPKSNNTLAVSLEEGIKQNSIPITKGKTKGSCPKRYFTNRPITLPIDNSQIVISNQWGNDEGFQKFIRRAMELMPNCEVVRIQ